LNLQSSSTAWSAFCMMPSAVLSPSASYLTLCKLIIHTTNSVSRGRKIGDSTLMEIFQAFVSVWGLRLLLQHSLCLQSSGMLHGVGRRPHLSMHLIRYFTV
jgi:hypothetical protein